MVYKQIERFKYFNLLNIFKMEPPKRNINVEVDEDLYFELRRKALDKKVDFHNYIRMIFQKEVK